jgi:hypothetical protein
MDTSEESASAGRSEDARREKFLSLEKDGATAASRWLGHPSLPDLTGRWRNRAEATVAPIADQLTDQLRTLEFLLYVCGIGILRSDWDIEPVPRWYLRPQQAQLMPKIREAFAQLLVEAARDFKAAGVPLDPGWGGDLVVVGELLLLDVDFELSVEELVEELQPLPPASLAPDARGTSVRRGTTSRTERTITQVRSGYEVHLEGPRTPAPYAAGKRRAVPSAVQARREALHKVREAFPDATVARIRMTFDSPIAAAPPGTPTPVPRTAGAYLRQLLREALGTEPDCPSQSTLYEDLTDLDGDGVVRDSEEDSG